MVVIGVDAHKRTHTFGVVDEVGRELANRTLPATLDGHRAALGWARTERIFALEDCRHLTRRLEADLIRAGERVVRVPARWPRPGGPAVSWGSPIRSTLSPWRGPRCESPGSRWPSSTGRPVGSGCWWITARTWWPSAPACRAGCAGTCTSCSPAKSLGRLAVIATLDRRLRQVEGTVAAIARELLGRIGDLTMRNNELEREITQLVPPLGPNLLAMPGCGPLSTAKILGEVAGAARFRSRAAFAGWNGTAPIPVWSGNDTRHRLNRGGNRQVNAALHRIALTQWGEWDLVEPTSSTAWPRATPRRRPCVSFVAGSPTRSSVASWSTRHSSGARR